MTNKTRRDLVAGAAGGLALAPFVRPTPAAATAASGPIERAYTAFELLAQAHDDACTRSWDCEDRYVEPERPGFHPGRDEGGHKIVPTTEGKGRVYLDDSAENIVRLRKITNDSESKFAGWSDEMHEARVERARATLVRIEAWQTECRRRADAAGLTEALEAENRIKALAQKSATRILAMEPTTWRELAFQAAILEGGCYDDEDVDSRRLVKRLILLAGIRLHWKEDPDALAKEIRAMGERQSADA